MGLKINTAKNKIMWINDAEQDPITLSREELKDIQYFVSQGSAVSKQSGAMENIKARATKTECPWLVEAGVEYDQDKQKHIDEAL